MKITENSDINYIFLLKSLFACHQNSKGLGKLKQTPQNKTKHNNPHLIYPQNMYTCIESF